MSFELRDVAVRHAGVRHGDPALALNGIGLSIAQGEQVALIGPSGAGKSTLLHTLACAHRPQGGDLSVFGQAPWALRPDARHALRGRLFLAPQTPPLPPRQRVVTAVLAGRLPQWSLGRALASLIRPRDIDPAWKALARFNLQDKLYSRVDRLSGGERQRCGIARLLVSNAEAFLVDEPLSALDPALSLQTLGVLQQEASSRNATLVCSLHQVDLALKHFPRVVGLRGGRIEFDLPAAQVDAAMIERLFDCQPAAGTVHESEPAVEPQTTIGCRC